MNYKQHFIIGIIFALTAIVFLNLSFLSISSLFLILLCAVFALLPDVDHDLSKGKQLLDYFAIIFSVFLSYLISCSNHCILSFDLLLLLAKNALLLLGCYFLFIRFFKPKHRGITHSLVFTISLSIFLYFLFGFQFAFFASLGYFSHLVADNHFKLL